MGQVNLGRLNKVDLRDAWIDESRNFTPWLAEQENLALLGETIGIELELQAQEKEVGPFRADILCKDTARTDEHLVLIENQLEKTDHTHLGQIITYAAGLDAVSIVWISSKITDEHRAALDWLNEITDERFNFFGLEIELWRIGDSPVAPKFNVVSQPNDWTRSVQSGVSRELSPLRKTQLGFWTAFKEYMEKEGSSVRCGTPQADCYMIHAIGRSGFYFASGASTWDAQTNTWTPVVRVELVLDHADGKAVFAALETVGAEIESDLGEGLQWYNPTNARVCRVSVKREADFTDEAQWPEQHLWLRQHVEEFRRVLLPRLEAVLDAARI